MLSGLWKRKRRDLVKVEIIISLAIYMAGMLYIGYWSYKKDVRFIRLHVGGDEDLVQQLRPYRLVPLI